MESFLDDLKQWASSPLDILTRIAVAAAMLAIAILLAAWASRFARRAFTRVRGMPVNAIGVITGIIYVAIITFGVLGVLNVLGLGQVVLSAVASLGIVGLVVSFALQDITKQFAAGVLLLLSHPFEVGDQIKVGAHEGEVLEIQLRVTRLKTVGGDEVMIPNAEVYTSTVYNMSRYPQRRLAVPLSLPLSDNLEAQRARVLVAVRAVQGVSPTPAPTVVCTTVADGKVSAEVRYWLERNTPDPDEVMTRVIVAANRALQA